MAPRLLSIAGSDSGGGAGIQADIKTACAFGVYASTAITAVTAQNTQEVTLVTALAPSLVSPQIDAVLSDIGADAIKIGMLANAGICNAVKDSLKAVSIPIVLDPVMVATSGGRLLDDEAVTALKALLPLVHVLTPNLPELDVLGGLQDPDQDARLTKAAELARRYDLAVLLKDGHGNGDTINDALITADGVEWFSSKRLDSDNTHGTGCTLSTAIACGLAKGQDLKAAIRGAREFVHNGIATAPGLGKGHGPLNFLQGK